MTEYNLESFKENLKTIISRSFYEFYKYITGVKWSGSFARTSKASHDTKNPQNSKKEQENESKIRTKFLITNIFFLNNSTRDIMLNGLMMCFQWKESYIFQNILIEDV